MFDKHAKEMFDEQLESAKKWPASSKDQAEICFAYAQGMACYALIRGDIGHEEFARLNNSIKAVRLNRTAKEIREQRLSAA
ncbi:hypothetical protein [Pseudomonas sp. NC02]|uniref:hypothetical protein n=1 Tax=Pseudomonas sp. NC02 TaxID=2067572 RepID=UPI000C848718|nr:hypothetical protein [Pseudomonas sp. NC02]AUO22500.1 hypothetical protein C0058_11040 [Pseudomonas sp. NC02]